jgi:hypothetical protein
MFRTTACSRPEARLVDATVVDLGALMRQNMANARQVDLESRVGFDTLS